MRMPKFDQFFKKWAFSYSCTSCSKACDFSDVEGHCSTRKFCHLTTIKVGLLVPLKDQQLLCSVLLHEWLGTVLYKNLQYFPQRHVSLWFASGIGGMLIWVFHCCNKSCLHKVISILDTYGFNFPLCPVGPTHSTHLILCFTWDKVAIPKS